MLTVVAVPEITKGAESSIIYLPVNMASQMEFFFTLRIFSVIFLLLLFDI